MFPWSNGQVNATGNWSVSSIPPMSIEFFETQDESENEIQIVREVIYLTDSEIDSGVE